MIDILGYKLRVLPQQRRQARLAAGTGGLARPVEQTAHQLFELVSRDHHPSPSAASRVRTQSSNAWRTRNSETETTFTERPSRAAMAWTVSPSEYRASTSSRDAGGNWPRQ